MRVKTRAGYYVSLTNDLPLRQEKYITSRETFYILHLSSGRRLSIMTPLPNIDTVTIGKEINK